MRQSVHPSEEKLEHFVSGSLPADETRVVVRHLLKGCEECRQVTSRLWPAAGWADSSVGMEGVSVRLGALKKRESRVLSEREEARKLLVDLEGHPPNRRTLLVLNSQRYHNWFLAELLLHRVFDLAFKDPSESLQYADLAVALADRLPTARYGEALVNDMRGRAWGALGNTRRINSDLAGAGQAFQKAQEFLESGTGDPLEEARLLGWRALYLKFRREVTESTRLYDKAIGIYRRLGDHHEMGRMMIDKGVTLCTGGDYEAAIRSTEEGLRNIDPEVDPRFALAAKHNLSLYLHRQGDVDKAMGLLQEILPLFAKQNDAMILLRLRWLEGRLAQAQRVFRRAEEAFREVQQGYVEREIPYEAASVSFDLATILVEEQRYDELVDLASQIIGIFSGLGVPRETLAALELLRGAAEAKRVSVSWITELAAYVERSQSNPGQKPFEPGS